MAESVLAIDLGTSSVKVLVVDSTGEIVSRGSAEYPTRQPAPGWAEQDPNDWWRAVVQAVREALHGTSHRIAGIGLTGQMHGTVLLDREGNALGQAIIWSDARASDDVETLTASIGPDRLIALTGSPLATGFQASTLHWLRRHQPDRFAQAATVLLPKDFIRWLMTAELATDPSDASGTGLFDVPNRQWSNEFLEALGLTPTMVPPIHPSPEPAGVLQPRAAKELGLPLGLPVTAGAGDASAAALAAGVISPETMMLTISTGSQVILPSRDFAPDPAGRAHTWCSAAAAEPDGAPWYRMGATLASGLALRWLRDRVFLEGGHGSFAAMTEQAATVPPGSRGLLFLPYLDGERSPHMDPTARGVFIGLTSRHGRAELTRAVMEGSVLAAFDAYAALAANGTTPARMVLAGGGAQSRLWQQIAADLFGIDILPMAEPDASALGAARLAAAMLGWALPPLAQQPWATFGAIVSPQPEARAVYQQLLPIFRRTYHSHRDDFPILAALDR